MANDIEAKVKAIIVEKLGVDEADERVAKVRYEVGRSVLVEYLDAYAALVRAQVNYAQALYELLAAQDKLQRAIGEW